MLRDIHKAVKRLLAKRKASKKRKTEGGPRPEHRQATQAERCKQERIAIARRRKERARRKRADKMFRAGAAMAHKLRKQNKEPSKWPQIVQPDTWDRWQRTRNIADRTVYNRRTKKVEVLPYKHPNAVVATGMDKGKAV